MAEFRPRNYVVCEDGMLTLYEMWRSIALDILYDGFYAAGGYLELPEEDAIRFMADEFYRTSEIYRTRGICAVASPSYTDIYHRVQDAQTYTDDDQAIWYGEVWDEVVGAVPGVIYRLESEKTSWLPDTHEIHLLHPSVVLGVLWAISHIPSEEERNQTMDSYEPYESD